VVPMDALPLRSFSGCFAAVSSTAPITTGYQGIEMYFVLGSVARVVKWRVPHLSCSCFLCCVVFLIKWSAFVLWTSMDYPWILCINYV
jgi:hypothetical protein